MPLLYYRRAAKVLHLGRIRRRVLVEEVLLWVLSSKVGNMKWGRKLISISTRLAKNRLSLVESSSLRKSRIIEAPWKERIARMISLKIIALSTIQDRIQSDRRLEILLLEKVVLRILRSERSLLKNRLVLLVRLRHVLTGGVLIDWGDRVILNGPERILGLLFL